MAMNVKLYYLYKMVKEIYIIGPIVAIFYLDKVLSFTDIMLLQSACWIASFIFEVPSGAFAEKFGRKVQQIIRGVQGPIIEKYLNKHTPSNKRATVISFNALSGSISSAIIINPLIGILMDRIGIFNTQISMGIAMFATTIFLYLYLEKVLQNKVKDNNFQGGEVV